MFSILYITTDYRLRIRMPESLAPVSQPTMGYGRYVSSSDSISSSIVFSFVIFIFVS